MKNMRILCGVIATMMSIGLFASTFGQDRCQPGQLETPPCYSAQQFTGDSTTPGQTQTPPAAETVDIISVVEVALIELLTLW